MRERVDCNADISIQVVEDEEQARETVSQMLTKRFPGSSYVVLRTAELAWSFTDGTFPS